MWKKKYSEFKHEKEDIPNSLKEMLQTTVPSARFVKKNRWFIALLVFFALIYIHNNFRVEALLKEHLNLTREIKELKNEAITTSSELMKKSRQSEVIRKVQENNLGLEILTTPPKTIIVKEK